MKSLAAVTCLVTLALAAPNDPSPRIIGGEETTPNEYPFMVLLIIEKPSFILTYEIQCGGTLLNNQWILTAGHCLEDGIKAEVVLGAHNVKDPREATQVHINTEQLFMHPMFSLHGQGAIYDVGLVKLPRPIEFNDVIQPVELAGRTPDSGELARAIGWGRIEGYIRTNKLRSAGDLPVVSYDDCLESFPETLHESSFCIDTTNGGHCSGDSGGPLILESTGQQIGISSFVSDSKTRGNDCENGKPHGFTDVDYFADWIEETMAEN